MKISELIKLLEEAKDKAGDVDVFYHNNEYGPEPIDQVRIDDDGYVPNGGLLIE